MTARPREGRQTYGLLDRGLSFIYFTGEEFLDPCKLLFPHHKFCSLKIQRLTVNQPNYIEILYSHRLLETREAKLARRAKFSVDFMQRNRCRDVHYGVIPTPEV